MLRQVFEITEVTDKSYNNHKQQTAILERHSDNYTTIEVSIMTWRKDEVSGNVLIDNDAKIYKFRGKDLTIEYVLDQLGKAYVDDKKLTATLLSEVFIREG